MVNFLPIEEVKNNFQVITVVDFKYHQIYAMKVEIIIFSKKILAVET